MAEIKFSSSSLIRLSEKYPDLHTWIYNTYAKQCGIRKDEFLIYTDQYLQHANSPVDLIWQAGTVVHICSRIHPADNADLFKVLMVRAFSDRDLLRELLRIPNEQKDGRFGGRLNKRATTFLLDPITDFPKRTDIRKFTTKMYVTVVVRDKATGREEHIEVVNGNAFEAQERAIKLLYGVDL